MNHLTENHRQEFENFVQEIMKKEDHETVLSVSHAGACYNFMRAVTDPSDELKKGFGNCCIFVYEYDQHRFIFKEIIRQK